MKPGNFKPSSTKRRRRSETQRAWPERRPMSSITTHPDQASSRLLISSQRDSLLLLVICRNTGSTYRFAVWISNKSSRVMCHASQWGGRGIDEAHTLRCRSVSLDFSLSQSMVWKSSYVLTSGKGSSRKSIRFPAPFISSVGVAALTPGRKWGRHQC